jgi:hypothetical protein
MWESLCARLVLPNRNKKTGGQFPPSVKKGKTTWDAEYDMPDGIIAHLTRECGGNVHTPTSSMSRVGRSRRRLAGPIHTQGYRITILVGLRRVLLIWRLVHVSVQLFAHRTKISLTRRTIGCATILRRGELCQHTAQSARIRVVGATNM